MKNGRKNSIDFDSKEYELAVNDRRSDVLFKVIDRKNKEKQDGKRRTH